MESFGKHDSTGTVTSFAMIVVDFWLRSALLDSIPLLPLAWIVEACAVSLLEHGSFEGKAKESTHLWAIFLSLQLNGTWRAWLFKRADKAIGIARKGRLVTAVLLREKCMSVSISKEWHCHG